MWSFRKPIATVEPGSPVFMLPHQIGLVAVTESILLDKSQIRWGLNDLPYILIYIDFWINILLKDERHWVNCKLEDISRFGITRTTKTTTLCISLAAWNHKMAKSQKPDLNGRRMDVWYYPLGTFYDSLQRGNMTPVDQVFQYYLCCQGISVQFILVTLKSMFPW